MRMDTRRWLDDQRLGIGSINGHRDIKTHSVGGKHLVISTALRIGLVMLRYKLAEDHILTP